MSKQANTKVRIRKSDEFRALLTETLPYEVPILFSNEGLYLAAKDKLTKKLKDTYGLGIFENRPTIPYKYKIRKNSYESRGLAVMHPAQQIETSLFYSCYDHLIVGLCQRSPFSLRAPYSIASYYVERALSSGKDPDKEEITEEASDGFGLVPSTATSYFAYKKYTFLYKFYDSHEFLRLEKKFKQLTQIDISDCFNRIYTHTIAWAVKSKSHAKKNKKKDSFESSFDKLIQNANHGETAGILIGPETSRIFAEIILQRIDLDIINRALQLKIHLDVDYTIRRYVDDYFIYTNNSATRETLKRIIPEALAEFKLAINHGKTIEQNRPYITETSIARHNISTNISTFFNKYTQLKKEQDDTGKTTTKILLKNIDNITAEVIQTITAVKRSVGASGSYDATANYFLGTFKKFLYRISRKKIESEAETGSTTNNLYFFLTAIIEIVFFYYSMTLRVRQTYQISEIILLIAKIMKPIPPDLKDMLVRKIAGEVRSVINQAHTDLPEHKIEVMNLLLVMRTFGMKYIFDLDLLSHAFEFEITQDKQICINDGFDYFQLVFLLSYVGGIPEFSNLVTAAVSHTTKRFLNKSWIDDAESVFIFFDLVSCPHIPDEDKTKIAKTVLRHISENNLNQRANELIQDIGHRRWFFGWNESLDIRLVLKKKELRTPY